MNRNVAVVFMSFLLTACIQNESRESTENQSDYSILIDLNKAEEVKFSTLFIDSRLIKLETLPDVLLADITKIKVHQGQFYILTWGSTNGLFVFDETGKFVKQILEKGDGPGQYGGIRNFDIQGDLIYLLDNKRLAIHTVDAFLGAYINSIKTDLFALDIRVQDNLLFLYAGNSSNNGQAMKVFALNAEGQIVDSYLPVDEEHEKYLNIIPKSVFSVNEKGFSLLEPFGYGILQYEKQAIAKVPIVFKGVTIPADFMSKEYNDILHFLELARKENIPILFSDFSESNRFYAFSIEYNGLGNRLDVSIDKESMKAKVIKKYIDDMVFENQTFNPSELKYAGLNIASQEYIYYLESPELDERLNETQKTEIELNSTDNPYLILLKK